MLYQDLSDLSVKELLLLTIREKKGDELLGKFGSLKEIAAASIDELKEAGLSKVTATKLKAIFELGKRYVSEPQIRTTIKSPSDIFHLLSSEMQWLDREVFRAVYLNVKNMVLATPVIAIGILDSCVVHPREVFKGAITRSAASIIVCHNHPSGDPTPSQNDLSLTNRLKEAGEVLGIRVLDHVIIGDGRYISLKERGIL
ncbi:MAG: RadC family protein [Caulobacteraceae bacterium]